ncbi:MAG: leucyl/phenylalanyl-tRNA--protein transferase [Porticoccaceae bacterium]|nr:leucyl/phenylalanyl-tRNA--protein transferase [Porticoccaceae bacterium]
MNLAVLHPENPVFPNPNSALKQPDGLLAAGGNLEAKTLISAYSQGIFPWYEEGEPILWWSPVERCIIRPKKLYISSRLRRLLRQQRYTVTSDLAFAAVISACAEPRSGEGTWITTEMINAYTELYCRGYAHSIEVWQEDCLVGGIYGVHVGRVFCGESMFSKVSNGSKIAIAHLLQWMGSQGMTMLDCQIVNPHLMSLGAQTLPRQAFLDHLNACNNQHLQWNFNQTSVDAW